MTQDERWKAGYDERMVFIAKNHRGPSKYNREERNNWNWICHQQKLMSGGERHESGAGGDV